MPRYKLIAFTKAVEGREGEYNDWYQDVHLGQVVAIDGIKTAQRFRLSLNLSPADVAQYMAIYDIETDDIEGVMKEISKRSRTERMIISDAMASAEAMVYEEFGAPVQTKA